MADDDGEHKKGFSLAKGPIAIIGIILLAAGILLLISGATQFPTDKLGDKNVTGPDAGKKFLGFQGNGWTMLLLGVSGLLLLLSAPLHWAGKSIGLIVGLVLGAASVIILLDKSSRATGDVFGLFSGNGPMTLLLGAAAAALLIFSLLPRVGGGRKRDD